MVQGALVGLLSLVITDQNQALVSATEPQTVAIGGDSLVISHTLTIPAGTTRLCRAAVLQTGSVTLTSTGSSQTVPCTDVQ